MRIIFLPFTTKDPEHGVLTRALARELAVRLARLPDLETSFLPFTHLVEGKRLFGVYAERWSADDLRRLLADEPEPDFVVHGDLHADDPFRLEVEVLRGPELDPVGEEAFESPRYDGFAAIEEAARFVARSAGLPAGSPALGESPARRFEAFLHFLRGREGVAALDGWGDATDPSEAYGPFLDALDVEPGMEAAEEGICLLAGAAATSGLTPLPPAEAALGTLLEAAPQSWRGWAVLSQVKAAAGDLRAAEEACRRALEIEPGRAALRYDLATVYLRMERFGRAAKTFETVRADDRLGADALFRLGTIRAKKDDLDGAIELWRESASRDPDRALVWANLGRALAARGEFDGAEEAFRRGLEAAQPSWFLHLAYGTHLLDQSRYIDAAEQMREVLRRKPGDVEAHLALGRSLVAEGDRRLSLQHLRKALRAGGEIAARARDAIEELTPAEREDELASMVENAIAREPEEQIVLLRALLREEASYLEAHVRLGLALVATGKARAAEKEFRRGLKLLPDDPEAWSGLATALKTRGKLKAALAAHDEALARAPESGAYHLNRADTLLRLGRASEAAAAVERARALEPHHPLLPNFVMAVKLFLSEKLDRAKKKG